MIVIRNDKKNNAVFVRTEKKELDLRLENQLTGANLSQVIEGKKDGDYTVFFINGKDVPAGQYMAYFGDIYATMCLCISVNSNVKNKYL